MRLLVGLSTNPALFYTHSPSEPVLVLGAIDLLYRNHDSRQFADALSTLGNDLCSAGLVDKGLLGELASRILLLTARDYASLDKQFPFGFVKPVLLLSVLEKLFGTPKWGDSAQDKFDIAFKHAHVNFSHWVVTRDPLPQEPTK
jgi:hypothetical protein